MQNNLHNDYYNALLTRDAKFDGKFFFGVKTTGIYCRPICPAKPKRENVEFFSSAELAEKAGYRPCLRCRPESAPDSPLWHGTTSVVRRAVRVLLNDEHAIELSEDELAERFGLSARHLRRLFQDELGKTPMQIMRDNRLNLARKLIVETDLSFVDIAFSSGFESVRRFNDAIRQRFSKTPTELRKRNANRLAKRPNSHDNAIEFSVAYRPPFDWDGCLAYYQTHRMGDLECFENDCYTRVFEFDGTLGYLSVSNNDAKCRLDINLHCDDVNAISFVLNRIKSMFDLSLDPVYVANAFEADPALNALYVPHHGVRLAGCWDKFELAITTILGQLVSVKRTTQLTRELMELYGEQHPHPLTGETVTLFPSPQRLASETLEALKVPRTKKAAIVALAQQVASGDIHFSSYQSPQEFKKQLLAIHGIGPWTAEYVALRAIGDTDAFPHGDVFLEKIIASEDLSAAIRDLSPWRGYLATTLYKYGAQL
ncbi:MAG: Ada metal-binding domain-containing protein [Amphritea sp.]